jgi:hypothetical protein
LLPQLNHGDSRPHAQPLPHQGFQEKAIQEIVRRLIAWHDMIYEHGRHRGWIGQQAGLLVSGQAVKGRINGHEEREGTRPVQGRNHPGH